MWALKLGGSILHAAPDSPHAAQRDSLLQGLRSQPGRFLLVPGGGRHADAVRAAQAGERFDDDTAHVRALAAMDLCAAELAAMLGGAARVITQLADATPTAAAGLTPIWAPHAELAGDHSLPRDWALTSDSIAAVAARRLGLEGVCLLKSCAVPPGLTAARLADSGIVDAEWPRQSRGLQTRVLGPAEWGLLSSGPAAGP